MSERTGRIIKSGQIGAVHPVPLPSAGPHRDDEKPCPPPAVTLHRNGDVVEAIEVTCGCGRTMIFACDYGTETQP